jgi:hypothetical protein
MRTYNSFLIRCWLIREPSQGERSIFDIEHIRTGEHKRMPSLNEACEWMLTVCQSAQAAVVTEGVEPRSLTEGEVNDDKK